MKSTAITAAVSAAALSALFLGTAQAAADSGTDRHSLKTKTRLVYFDRDFDVDSSDREQSALAVEANYLSPQYGDWIGVGLSGYFVQDLSDSGLVREDVLTINNGQAEGFAVLGEAYLKLTPTMDSLLKLGRQRHKSMFLSSSGSRAVPNTFQGFSGQITPAKGLSIYGAVYDQWSRRADDAFNGFATDQSANGDIDYLSILGVKYKGDGYSIDGEYLNSDDYLSKLGLRGSYVYMLETSQLKFGGGIFASYDDGDLFVTRAESGDLDDEDIPGSVAGVTPSANDGLGIYADVAWQKDAVELSAAIAKFDDIWIEDNFAGDHGTNPFPTRSRIGPDLTNANETVLKVQVKYDWKAIIPGLQTTLAAAQGWDAENSVNAALGTADEDWKELTISYKVPEVKGLKISGIWHDYHAVETGSVDGVKGDETDIRLYLDYVYNFQL